MYIVPLSCHCVNGKKVEEIKKRIKKTMIMKDFECCSRVVGNSLGSHLLGLAKTNKQKPKSSNTHTYMAVIKALRTEFCKYLIVREVNT